MSKRIPIKKRYCIEKLVRFDKRFGLEKWETTKLSSNNLSALFLLLVDGYRIWDNEDRIVVKPTE